MTPPYTAVLRVFFCDVGPTRTAHATLEVRSYPNGGAELVPVQGGWRSLRGAEGDAWLWSQMQATLDAPCTYGGVIGMEYIDGALYDRKRWQDLGETMRVEGDIRRTAEVRGVDHVMLPFREMRAHRVLVPRALYCVPASSWRAELCQRGSASNAEIRLLVEYLAGRRLEVKPGQFARVIDLPAAGNAEAREHIMDALGGAIVLASVFLGAPLKVPNEVRAAQELARVEGRRKKSVKKTLAGLPPGYDLSQAKMPDGSSASEYMGKRQPSRAVKAGRRTSSANTKSRKAGGR